MALASIIVAATSALVAVVALFVAWWGLRESRKANAFPATVTLFAEYRTERMVEARRVLAAALPGLAERTPVLAIRELPDDVRDAAEVVAHYLDNLGVLVAHKLVRLKLVAGFLGVSALRQWDDLEPFIQREREVREREARGAVYQLYYQDLAKRLRKLGPEEFVKNKLR